MLKPQSFPLIARLGLAVAATGFAAVVTWLLPGAQEVPYFSIFVLAVLVSSWYGGWTGGLFSTALSILAVSYLIAVPVGSLAINSREDLIRLASFLGVALMVCGFTAAVRGRAAAHEALSETEARYRLLFQDSPLPMWVFDRQTHRFLEVNEAAVENYGYSREEFLRMTLEDIRPAEDRKRFRNHLAEPHQRGLRHGDQWRHLKKDGTVIDVEISAHDLEWQGLSATLVLASDITERNQAEEALTRSEEIYRRAIENAAGVPFRLIFGSAPRDSYYDYVGGGITDLLGVSPAEFTERRFREMAKEVIPLLPEIPADPEECRRAMLRGELPQYKADVRVITATGEEKWLNDTSLPLRDEKTGKIIGALGILVDITHRKRAEQVQLAVYRIAEAASRPGTLDDLYAAVHQIIWEVMPAANFYIALYDKEKDLLSFPYFVDEADSPPSPRKPAKELTSYVLRTGRPLLCTAAVDEELRARGEVDCVGAPSAIWLGVPLHSGEKNIGVMVVQHYADPAAYSEREQQILEYVSSQVAVAIERKQGEVEFRRLSAAVEQSPASVMITDIQGKIEYVNRKFTEVTGYSLEEVRGQTPRFLKSGETPPDVYKALWEIINAGREWHGEFHNRKKDGALFWERASISPILDASGAISHFLAVKEDITAMKALEDQLRQAQKMEAVGRLAGGVAHDFNNLLMVISGYAELLHDRFESDDVTTKNLDEILKASKRAAALTRQLLAFSRKQVLEPKVVNLNDVVADVEKMLRRLIGEDVELVTRLGSRLGSVRADPGQVEQLLMNLVVNSRDAMPGGGRLVIETSNKTVDDAFAAQHLGLHPGEWVTMSVTDTGAGMDADTLAHIFEPFFTTKEKGKGTGLGLATVYGIVKQSGGYISVSSEQGGGTTFVVYFSRVDELVKPAATAATAGVSAGGKETVLVVEDEEGVRDVAVECLRAKGYTVLSATDANQALYLAGQHPGPLHLLLTDLVLPGMSGRDLAGQLAAQRPETKVVYMSGYVRDAFLSKTELPPGTEFLQKPFSPSLLVRKVREILDA